MRQRIALRGWHGPLPDAEDLLERERTRYVLQRGGWSLLPLALGRLLSSPGRFLQALGAARRMARESGRSLPYHIVYLAEACRLLSWTAAAGVHHVHAHFGTNSVEVVMLARILGGPHYSFTVHGPEEFLAPMGLAEKVHCASFAVAISSYGCSQVYFLMRFEDWPKVQQVHCGIERSFYAHADELLPGQTNRLVCVGRLCEAKGQLLLVEAAAALFAEGIDFELVLAGDGPLREQLEARIRSSGLADRVRITGWISSPEVRAQLLAPRALVLPSFAEGLPVVIMEAMSLRRPVIAPISGASPNWSPGGSGWLVPAGSIGELTAAMRDCLSRPAEQMQRLGTAAYERVMARHDIETEALKLAVLFAEASGIALPERR